MEAEYDFSQGERGEGRSTQYQQAKRASQFG